jgi:YgiT-type zinc finger domain-containing protein
MEEQVQEPPVMICLICRQADTVDGVTSVPFERGEMHLMISGVPAHLCPGCGEAYVEQEVAVRLLQIAQAAREAGALDNHCEYHTGYI